MRRNVKRCPSCAESVAMIAVSGQALTFDELSLLAAAFIFHAAKHWQTIASESTRKKKQFLSFVDNFAK